MGTINISDRIVATLYSLGTWFVSGIYVQIPCVKEIVSLPIIIIIIWSAHGCLNTHTQSVDKMHILYFIFKLRAS
jgi:hypothetical protein